jgi:type IV pilus biogenesis protein CpaD/CtpE
MMLKYKLAVLALMAALVAGCASNTVPDPDPTDTTYGESRSGADTDVYADDP